MQCHNNANCRKYHWIDEVLEYKPVGNAQLSSEMKFTGWRKSLYLPDVNLSGASSQRQMLALSQSALTNKTTRLISYCIYIHPFFWSRASEHCRIFFTKSIFHLLPSPFVMCVFSLCAFLILFQAFLLQFH